MSQSRTRVDTVVDARWIIPVQPAGIVLENHSVAVASGRVIAIRPTTQANQEFDAANHVSLAEHALIPGLVNLHTHASMTLMRGLADDQPLMDWLNHHIWPVESRLASAEFVHDGALLACAEMLLGGTTCFNDMYFFPESVAGAALHAGIRAGIGIIAIEMPTLYASDASDYLAKGLETRDALRDEPLISFCLAPHAPYTVSDATFSRIGTYAAELDLPVHVHVHETPDEIQQSVTAYGKRPLQRLQEFGLLGPGLIAVHGVHFNDEEIDLLARHGCHVAHCPASNLKLASGFAPVSRLMARGVNVGIGTDGAASNNRLDMFAEMRLAALLAKGASGSTTALPAHAALAAATLAGARALGLEGEIGSLEPGKRADMTAIDLSGPELAPCYDPVSHLVYAAGREHVSHVWVDGALTVQDGALTRLDSREIVAKAGYWKDKIRG